MAAPHSMASIAEREPGPSVLTLGQAGLELVLERLEAATDRNSFALVCKDFRDAERPTRQHLRLRCTRKQIELAPASFGAVTDLDLSSIFPPRFSRCDLSDRQLAHLGRCFPNVRSLTLLADGCQEWLSKGRLPFEGTWPSLDVVTVVQPGADRSKRFKALVNNRIGGSPLVLANLREARQPGVGLPFSKVRLVFPKDKDLEALAKTNVAHLASLEFELLGADPFSLDHSVLNSTNFPELTELNALGTWFDTGDERIFKFTEEKVRNLLEGFPHLTSFALRAITGFRLTTLPLSEAQKCRLRSLRLDLLEEFRSPGVNFDLAPLLECTSLEQLELVGDKVLTFNKHAGLIVAIVKNCQNLKCLKLGLWERYECPSSHELINFFQQIEAASPRSLAQIEIQSKIEGRSFSSSLLAPFTPFCNKITSLTCRICPPRAASFVIGGLPLLRELDLGFDAPYLDAELLIDCHRLQTFTLTASRIVGLTFIGARPGVSSLNLCFEDRSVLEKSEASRQLASFIRTLTCLDSLTSLSLDCRASFSIPWAEPEPMRAFAELPVLKRLKLGTSYGIDSEASAGYAAQHFHWLLGSTSLKELRVSHQHYMKGPLAEFYSKLYGHEDAGHLVSFCPPKTGFRCIEACSAHKTLRCRLAEGLITDCELPYLALGLSCL